MTNKKGFTLIELLVVIAIIGILSAIGLVSLNGAREKARDAKARSDLATVKSGLALFYDDNNSAYPGNVTAGTDDMGNGSTAVLGTTACTTGATTNTCTKDSIWDATKKILVPTYVADLKAPATSGTNKYGYKASNFTSTNGGTVGGFVLYYKLEGAGGLDYYTLDNTGTVKDTSDTKTTLTACTIDSSATSKTGTCPQS